MSRQSAIIVDVDGTLALRNLNLENPRGPYNGERVKEDLVNEPIANLITSLEALQFKVLIVTGRDGLYESLTKEWLTEQGIPFDDCFSRPPGNNDSDATIKKEIYLEQIEPFYKVHYVFDDRDSVVKMWRGLNLTCLQVAEGNF